MIPSWTLLALTALFFIREVWIRSKQKPSDYDMGYRQAFIEIGIWWNTHNTDEEFIKNLREWIQCKLKGR